MDYFELLFLLRTLIVMLFTLLVIVLIYEFNCKRKENYIKKTQSHCNHEYEEKTYFYHFNDIDYYFKCKKCGITKGV